MKQKIQNLLNDEDFLKVEQLLNQFNIFKALNRETKENPHSDFLAFLFNPRGSHGLGDFFLKEFLKETFPEKIIELDSKNFSNISIKREWYCKKDRLDVVLFDSHAKEIYAIEHKIQSKQGNNQLKRYLNHLDKKFRDYKKYPIFLTKSGEDAKADRWQAIDYEVVLNVLNKTLNCYPYSMSISIRELLNQYKSTIERYILMSDETLNDLCKSIYQHHKEALDYIMDNAESEDSIRDVMKMISTSLEKYKDLFEIYGRGNKRMLLSLKEFSKCKQLQEPDDKDKLFKQAGNYIGILFEARSGGIRCLFLVASTQTNNEVRFQLVNYFRNHLDNVRKIGKTEQYTTIASFPHFISEIDVENIENGTLTQKDIDERIKRVINQYEQCWKPNLKKALQFIKKFR